MKKQTAEHHDFEYLAEDAKDLLLATAEVAEEKVIKARQRLTAALERGKDALAKMQAKAVQGAHATDETIRSHPYQSIGIAFGVGALLGLFIARRH